MTVMVDMVFNFQENFSAIETSFAPHFASWYFRNRIRKNFSHTSAINIMPTKFCTDCSLKLGIFKRKFYCKLCLNHFCNDCFSKVKRHAELFEKSRSVTVPSCLKCVVLHDHIKRDHLFLLANKQLADYLKHRRISTTHCTEKYHLVDLIMDFALSNGLTSPQDRENDARHRGHLAELRENERVRQLEDEQTRIEKERSHPSPMHSSNNAEDVLISNNIEDFVSQNNGEYVFNVNSENLNSPIMSGNITNELIQNNITDLTEPFINPESDVISASEETSETPFDLPRAFQSTECRNNVSELQEAYIINTDREDSLSERLPGEVSPQLVETNVTSTSTERSENFHQSEGATLGETVDVGNGQVELETATLSTSSTRSYGSPKKSPSRHQASGRWCSVEDIQQEEDIESLTVLELKQVLTANFINFRGCVEKEELVEKVKILYASEQKAKAESEARGSDEAYERDLCKICMDHAIDCVLLDCGHLVACTKCGKRLAQCPICRSLVARVVHVFRV